MHSKYTIEIVFITFVFLIYFILFFILTVEVYTNKNDNLKNSNNESRQITINFKDIKWLKKIYFDKK